MKLIALTIFLAGFVIGGVFYQGSLSEKYEKLEDFKEDAEDIIDEVQA